MLQDNNEKEEIKENTEQKTIQELVLENHLLLSENNELLKKMNKINNWSFGLRVVWFLILLGVPFIAYYYLVEPLVDSEGSAFESIWVGLQNIPGWKQFCTAVVTDM